MRRSILPLLLFCLFSTIQAAHFPGGTISYRCVGTNIYEFKMLLWRDCSGSAMLPQSLLFESDCGLNFTIGGLLPIDVEEVSPLCAAEWNNSSCNGGGLPGLQALTYTTTQFLSPCAGWTISWSTCCRDNSLNAVGTSGLYVETRLNTIAAPCNDSPIYSDPKIPYICIDQTVHYDAGVVSTSGNTLRHRFIEARFATPVPFPVNYLPPHYYGEPWTGMVIDSLSGMITFTPNTLGKIITAIQVDEYAPDGTWIGSVMRDFLFVVVACDNALPDIDAGTITAVTGTGEMIDGYSVRSCANGTLCLDLLFTDPNNGQTLSFTSNVDVVLPGATWELNGTNPATVTLCWDASDAEPGLRQFGITAMDDACPITGVQDYAYTIEIVDPPFMGGSGTALVCSLSPPFALVDSLDMPADDGQWSDPNGGAHSGIMDPSTDPSGLYTYTSESFPGCVGSTEVMVSFLPDSDPFCILLSITERNMEPTWTIDPGTGELLVQGLEAWNGSIVNGSVLDVLGRLLDRSSGSVSNGTWRYVNNNRVSNGVLYLHIQVNEGASIVLPVVIDR